jgi:predicted MFS family arabinose efflux permease
VICGTLLASAAMATVALDARLSIAAPANFISGAGFYMLHNTLQTHATQMMPMRRGAAAALFATCFFLGQSAGAGAGVLGVVADHLGTRPVLLFGAIMLVPIGLWLGYRLHLRPGTDAMPLGT